LWRVSGRASKRIRRLSVPSDRPGGNRDTNRDAAKCSAPACHAYLQVMQRGFSDVNEAHSGSSLWALLMSAFRVGKVAVERYLIEHANLSHRRRVF
jgi:hypothetical protein